MNNEETQLSVETASGWAVQPVNDDVTAIIFKMKAGPLGVALGNQDFSRLACRIILEAQKHAAKHTPTISTENLTADPIPTLAMGLAKGRTEEEAFLSMKLGNLTMVFAVELSILREICADLLPRLSVMAPKAKN